MRKYGNPRHVCYAYEQGRLDAMHGRIMNSALTNNQNRTVSQAYKNGYSEGQLLRGQLKKSNTVQ